MRPLEFIGLFAICASGMFIIYWLLAGWGKRCLKEANEYEEYYEKLKIKIYGFTVGKCNCRILSNQFDKLYNMKSGNKEKNDVLYREFENRFKSVM